MLIADDDAAARAMYGRFLRSMGCSVVSARDGLEAVDCAKALHPNVIVMDLGMPRLDGWTAIARIRKDPATRRIPIVALSGVELSRTRARTAGADVFLAKPCLPEMLWWQVRTLVRPRRRLQRAPPPTKLQ